MRKMVLLLWAGLAHADTSVPPQQSWGARCGELIHQLSLEHPERYWSKPTKIVAGWPARIAFSIGGPEDNASIIVSVGADSSGRVEDTAWLDKRGPTPAGKTPEAAWFRHAGNQYAMITVWHTEAAALATELQHALDTCMNFPMSVGK